MTRCVCYLARRLHLPSGEVLRNYVVAGCGVELKWYPFVGECHSMLLVDDLCIREDGDGGLFVDECSPVP